MSLQTLQSPLHLACEKGNLVILNNVLSRGFDIELEDSEGSTPLVEAAKWGRTNAVAFLIAQGASPYAVDNVIT